MRYLRKALCCLLAAVLLCGCVLPSYALGINSVLEEITDTEGDVSQVAVDPDRFTEVPLYLQTDYPDTLYGHGTVKSSGCSITSLAMVATYLTGHIYKPDELAAYFGGRAANNMARMEYGSDKLQLPYYKTWYFTETMDALRAGKIAIVLMEEDSLFTESQHFIVLTGLTEDGKILINDPWGPNYDRWELENGFANGFEEGDILCGFSGAWIYDKSAMPDQPYVYREELPSMENSRYPEVVLTPEERNLLARVVWVESRGESPEGQQAVAEVVLNRMVSEDFPNTMKDVIYAEGQFRSVPKLEEAEPNQTQYDAITRALCGPNVLPMDVFFFATEPTNENVWGTIGGHIFCYQE